MAEEEGKKKKKQLIFFHVKGLDNQINPYTTIGIHRTEYFDEHGGEKFCLLIRQMFGEEIMVKWNDEETRNKEHEILLSKFMELDIIFR